MADDTDTPKTVVIIIQDTESTHRFAGNTVPVAVNGTIARIPYNQETTVGEHITGALTDAGIPFTVVAPKGETGSGAEGVSVLDPLTLTAPAGSAGTGGEGSEAALTEPQSLKKDPGTVHIETDIETNKLTTNKDGEGSTLGQTADETGGSNANGTSGTEGSDTGGNDTGGDSTGTGTGTGTGTDDTKTAEPGPLDTSIADLTETLKSVNGADELDALLNAEKAGKKRSGAISAIEARKAQLTAA